MKVKLIIILSFLTLTSCFKDQYLETNNYKVNLQKYSGKWYEIARLPNRFEKNCKNVTAEYTLEKDTILVKNTCFNTKENKIKVANGSAYSKNELNTKLKVTFFKPFYGDYWILKLDKDYNYALIGSPDRKYLWILSRNKKLEKNITEELLNYAKSSSFDLSNIIWTIQE